LEIEFGYLMPLPLNNVNARPTPMRERHVFFKQGERLYELYYMALAEHYSTWLEAFRTLVQSFALPEEAVSQASYRPVITAAPQYIREDEVAFGADKGGSSGESERPRG